MCAVSVLFCIGSDANICAFWLFYGFSFSLTGDGVGIYIYICTTILGQRIHMCPLGVNSFWCCGWGLRTKVFLGNYQIIARILFTWRLVQQLVKQHGVCRNHQHFGMFIDGCITWVTCVFGSAVVKIYFIKLILIKI